MFQNLLLLEWYIVGYFAELLNFSVWFLISSSGCEHVLPIECENGSHTSNIQNVKMMPFGRRGFNTLKENVFTAAEHRRLFEFFNPFF